MLSFETDKSGKTINIQMDEQGMATLMEALARLMRNGDHVHLWGPAFGGTALSATTPFGDPAVQEVVIDFRPDYDYGETTQKP